MDYSLKDKFIDISKKMNVSYLRDKTLNLVIDIIKENNIKTVLEIGTGVGYSSYMIATNFKNINIDSVELSQERFNVAKELLTDFENICIFNINCFQFKTSKQYDLILIDGPKRNQKELLNKLINYAHDDTIFFIDNIKLQKIRSINQKSNNQQKIIDSLDEFKTYLDTNPNNIKFKYIDIEDGVMVGSRKWN